MPWVTPTLEETRALNRDNVQAKLRSGPMVPNSVLRVMSDANAGLAYLTLLYLDWLARQLMPDTAETEWLDRFGTIWLGGRKTATYATGTATVTGIVGTVMPSGTELQASGQNGASVLFQTTADVTVSGAPASVPIISLEPGQTNLQVNDTLALTVGQAGIDGGLVLASINDGVPEETDDELRARVLDRIREPPMGGDAEDYVQWALQVPGVTRAWTAPNEMGIGTVTVRFMMDDLRATTNPMTNGFPTAGDVATVTAYLDTKRPATTKDFFVEAPIPEPINFTLQNCVNNDTATQNAINASVTKMLAQKAAPGHAIKGVLQSAQTIYAAWVSEAVMAAEGVEYFDLVMSDHAMPNNGCLAVLGTITYT